MSEDRFELQPDLTGVALAYRNKTFIADLIFPKVPVSTESFQYRLYNKTAFMTVPETLIGEKGSPRTIDLKSSLESATVENHALKEETALSKISEAANKNINLRSIITMQLADCLKSAREVRMSALLADKNNYGANYKKLNSNEKINAEGTNAVNLIQDAIDEMFIKANTMVLSRKAASELRRNPAIVSAVNRNNSTSGIVSIEDLKTLFELDNIFVGETMINTAKKGQIPVYGAAWANNISLMYINPVANSDYGLTFGFKAQHEDLTVGTYVDPDKGTKGCEVQKVFESSKDLIICPECGYLLEEVI